MTLKFTQSTEAKTWTLNVSDYLPFGGNARTVTSVVTEGPIINTSGSYVYHFPRVAPNAGANNDQVQLSFPEDVRGSVQVTARVDKPV